MQLPDFFICENKDYPGIGLILSTRIPFNLGRPYRFESSAELERFMIKYNLLDSCANVDGYNIIIVWFGTLEKVAETVPLGNTVKANQVAELKEMVTFYYQQRILGNESRLKKYVRKG